MALIKHVYTVDPATKVVTAVEQEATIVDILNPSVTLVDPVSRLARFGLYSFLAVKLIG